MNGLRILVVDDHAVVRRGVRATLEAHPGWKVVGEAANGRESIEEVKKLKPDLIVIDLTMPEMNGLDATRLILQIAPQTEVLIFTIHHSRRMAQEALEAGARGYVAKSDPPRDLVAAVEALSRHETFWKLGDGNPSPRAA